MNTILKGIFSLAAASAIFATNFAVRAQTQAQARADSFVQPVTPAGLMLQTQDSLSASLLSGTTTNSGAVVAVDVSGNSGIFSPMFGSYAIEPTSLWLEITNVVNGVAYLNLHNATNQVYAIWGTTNLPGGWNVESELWPTNSDVMPFTELTLYRHELFLVAEDWTGVTENGNTVPDWWLWKYFGTTSLYDTNLDAQGNALLFDYRHSIDPTNTYPPGLVGYWPFDTADWMGVMGQLPVVTNGLQLVPGHLSNAVHMGYTNSNLRYNYAESSGRTNINLQNGSIVMWFKPDWSSVNLGGAGLGVQENDWGNLIGVDSTPGFWELYFDPQGNDLWFDSGDGTNWSPSLEATISWNPNEWHQIVLTYSSSNSTLYIDGAPHAQDSGISAAPIFDNFASENNFTVGSDKWTDPVNGTIDELRTYNFPLNAAQVAAGLAPPGHPEISIQPQSQTVLPGSNATISVSATGDSPLYYQWYFDGNTAISGGTSSTLNLTNITTSSAGTYVVVVTNAVGAVTSSIAMLDLPGPADGEGLLARWHFDSIGWLGEQGQVPVTWKDLDLTPGLIGNGLSPDTNSAPGISLLVYNLVESNGTTNLNLQTGTVIFWYKPNWTSINAGGSGPPNFQFLLTATDWSSYWSLHIDGLGNTISFGDQDLFVPTLLDAGISFQSNEWYQIALTYDAFGSALYTNGVLVATGAGVTTIPSTSQFEMASAFGNFPVDGSVDELKTFSSVLNGDRVFQDYYINSGQKAPLITQQPRSLSNVVGTAAFSVNVIGNSPFSYQWYFNGTTALPDATNAALTLNNVQGSDAGAYSVVVSNSYGVVTSSQASLTFSPPVIQEQPQSQAVIPGTSATFTVVATSALPLQYQWYFNSTTALAGQTNATLTINNVQQADVGIYSVVVSNGAETIVSSNATLGVTLLASWHFETTNWFGDQGQVPIQETDLQLASGVEGNAVQIAHAGSDLAYNVVESNRNTNLALWNGSIRFWFMPNWSSADQGGTGPGAWAPLFDAYGDDGNWELYLSPDGTQLYFDSDNEVVGAKIITGPCSWISNQWSQIALTYTPSNSQLYINGQLIAAGGGVTAAPDCKSFLMGNDASGDRANGKFDELETFGYPLDANTNLQDYLSLSNAIALTIIQQPQDQLVMVGSNATFTVGVSSGSHLSYQWYFNTNTPILGATNSTLAFPVAPANRGLYRVIVSDGAVTITSADAQLTLFGDSDGDGIPDDWEMQNIGTIAYGASDLDATGNTFLYDYQNNIDPVATLGVWHFDAGNWTGTLGQTPIITNNLQLVSGIVSNAVELTSTNSQLCYNVVETNGYRNLDLQNGSARFWFKPNWSSADQGGAGPGDGAVLVDAYGEAGNWELYFSPDGTQLYFDVDFGADNLITAQYSWISNQWAQIVLTYTPSNSQLYINGQLIATGAGVIPLPELTVLSIGDDTLGNVANGTFDELQTFDHPLSVDEIAAGLAAYQGAPLITQQPQSLADVVGTATFSVNATGNTPLSFQWYYNGVTALPDATNATLTLNNVQWSDAGSYSVVVSNSYGAVTSFQATLTFTPPVILQQPLTQSPLPGSNVVFTVVATSALPLQYQWYFNSTTALAGQTNTTLTINNVQQTDTGFYDVVVTSDAGATVSSNAMLNLADPNAPTGLLGSWQFDTTNWFGDQGQVPVQETDLQLTNGVASNAVQIVNADSELAYNVVESNGSTNLDLWNGSIRFWFMPNWSSADQGGTGPGDWAVLVDAHGDNGNWQLYLSPDGTQLYFDSGNDTNGANLITVPYPWISNQWAQITLTYTPSNSQLYINGQSIATGIGVVAVPDANAFSIGNDTFGNLVNGTFDEFQTFDHPLNVDEIAAGLASYQGAPLIIQQPQSLADVVGAPIFSVNAIGSSPLSFQWYYNGTDALPDATNATLTINNAQWSNSGAYSVVVSNSYGAVRSFPAVLTFTPPVIQQQPQDQAVLPGSAASFTVVATNALPLQYQWYFNSTTALAGQTNATLIVNSAQSANVGTYNAVVSSAAGAVVSSNAVLSMLDVNQAYGLLSRWHFDTNDWVGEQGQAPINPNNLQLTSGAFSNAVQITSSGANLRYKVVESNSHTNLNVQCGTVRFWFRPHWSSSRLGDTSFSNWGSLIEVDSASGFWGLRLEPQADYLQFTSSSATQSTNDLLIPVYWASNQWHQIAFTYTPSNAAIYVDGALTRQITGVRYVPSFDGSDAQNNFTIGNDIYGRRAIGDFDELETFDRPLTAAEIANLFDYYSGPPIITAQPQNETAMVGWNVTIDSGAVGAGQLGYQWYFEQTNLLVGQTNSSLLLTNVQLSQSGIYSVAISDSFGTTVSSNASLTVSTNAVSACRLAAGYLHFLAMRQDGTAWSWGGNDSGELGNGTTTGSPVPVGVPGLSNVVSISAQSDAESSYAVTADGTVWSWGDNSWGQLGRADNQYTNDSRPAPVYGLKHAIAVAAGRSFAIALKGDGTVWGWGANYDGELGDGSAEQTTDIAAPIIGLSNIVAIAGGGWHCLALRADGTVWGVGNNGDGELGIGTTDSQSYPVQIPSLTNIVTLIGGSYNSAAILSDGTLLTWGDDSGPQLGYPTVRPWISKVPTPVPGLSNIVTAAFGSIHTLAGDTNGTVWAWGDNEYYQLESDLPPPAWSYVPVALDQVSNLTFVAGGSETSCGWTGTNTILVWGNDVFLGRRINPLVVHLYDQTDTDGDGLPDWFEVQTQITLLGNSAVTNWSDPNNPDSDYDGVSDYQEIVDGSNPMDPGSAPSIRLGYWKFDTTNWLGEAGQQPLHVTNVQSIPSWDVNALHVGTNTPASIAYHDVEANGLANINLRTGTVRFWFKPDWQSSDLGGSGPGTGGSLITVGDHASGYSSDFWGLEFDSTGNTLQFSSEGGGQQSIYLDSPVSLSSTQWCQITLTYSTNGTALYTNGQLAATGTGIQSYPSAAVRHQLGFDIGSSPVGARQMFGAVDDLETFNYQMGGGQVASDFASVLSSKAIVQFPNTYVASHNFSVTIAGVPVANVAVLINNPDFSSAVGQLYFGNPTVQVPINVPTDGTNMVYIGIWNGSQFIWHRKKIIVDTTPPVIVPPAQSATLQTPILQLSGYSTEPLSSITYDLVNTTATNLDRTAFVTKSSPNTNWFQCFDVQLAAGLNTITLRAADLAGNVQTNVYLYTLDVSSMTNPPTVTVNWPAANAVVAGSNATLTGYVSDPSVAVTAQVVLAGVTNNLHAQVERNGKFWIDNVPLGLEASAISIQAQDVAGNVTNAAGWMQGGGAGITLNPINPNLLKGSNVTVSGRIASTGYRITVNGVPASTTDNGDGTVSFEAPDVPVTSGGVATFDVDGTPTSGTGPSDVFQFSQDKPSYIRVSSYTENIHEEDHLAPYCYADYWDYTFHRNRTWANGVGGTGSGDYYYFLSQTIWNIPPSVDGPASTEWDWPAEEWAPSLVPDSDATETGSPNDWTMMFTFCQLIPFEHFDYGDETQLPNLNCDNSYSLSHRTADTHLELVVGGRAGRQNLVLLQATAAEFTDPGTNLLTVPGAPFPVDAWRLSQGYPTNYIGDKGISPENIQIAGIPAVPLNTITNVQGVLMQPGAIYLPAPAGTNIDITPVVQNVDSGCYTFDVQVAGTVTLESNDRMVHGTITGVPAQDIAIQVFDKTTGQVIDRTYHDLFSNLRQDLGETPGGTINLSATQIYNSEDDILSDSEVDGTDNGMFAAADQQVIFVRNASNPAVLDFYTVADGYDQLAVRVGIQGTSASGGSVSSVTETTIQLTPSDMAELLTYLDQRIHSSDLNDVPVQSPPPPIQERSLLTKVLLGLFKADVNPPIALTKGLVEGFMSAAKSDYQGLVGIKNLITSSTQRAAVFKALFTLKTYTQIPSMIEQSLINFMNDAEKKAVTFRFGPNDFIDDITVRCYVGGFAMGYATEQICSAAVVAGIAAKAATATKAVLALTSSGRAVLAGVSKTVMVVQRVKTGAVGFAINSATKAARTVGLPKAAAAMADAVAKMPFAGGRTVGEVLNATMDRLDYIQEELVKIGQPLNDFGVKAQKQLATLLDRDLGFFPGEKAVRGNLRLYEKLVVGNGDRYEDLLQLFRRADGTLDKDALQNTLEGFYDATQSTTASKPRLYLNNPQIAHPTGYRYVDDISLIRNSGNKFPIHRGDGWYCSFDEFSTSGDAVSKLQLPNGSNAKYRVEFATGSVRNNARVPYGLHQASPSFEPLCVDYPTRVSGGVTQVLSGGGTQFLVSDTEIPVTAIWDISGPTPVRIY
jgi:hypothetical protein